MVHIIVQRNFCKKGPNLKPYIPNIIFLHVMWRLKIRNLRLYLAIFTDFPLFLSKIFNIWKSPYKILGFSR